MSICITLWLHRKDYGNSTNLEAIDTLAYGTSHEAMTLRVRTMLTSRKVSYTVKGLTADFIMKRLSLMHRKRVKKIQAWVEKMAAVAFWVVVNTWLASLQFFFLLWLLSFPVGAKNNTNGNKISPHYQLLLYNEAIIYSKVLTQENNFSKGAHIPSFKIFSWFAAKPNTWSTKVPKCRWKYSNGSVIWEFSITIYVDIFHFYLRMGFL